MKNFLSIAYMVGLIGLALAGVAFIINHYFIIGYSLALIVILINTFVIIELEKDFLDSYEDHL